MRTAVGLAERYFVVVTLIQSYDRYIRACYFPHSICLRNKLVSQFFERPNLWHRKTAYDLLSQIATSYHQQPPGTINYNHLLPPTGTWAHQYRLTLNNSDLDLPAATCYWTYMQRLRFIGDILYIQQSLVLFRWHKIRLNDINL